MKFVKVKECSVNVFFQGTRCFLCELEVTEDEIIAVLDRVYGSGNWQRNSLKIREVKVKEKVFEEQRAKIR